ncbi:hypothetical protein CVT26_011577, partial [Gymnopilus dilepis]
SAERNFGLPEARSSSGIPPFKILRVDDSGSSPYNNPICHESIGRCEDGWGPLPILVTSGQGGYDLNHSTVKKQRNIGSGPPKLADYVTPPLIYVTYKKVAGPSSGPNNFSTFPQVPNLSPARLPLVLAFLFMAYTQQPMATPSMTVGGGNRNAKNLPVGPDGREWSEGLCGCFGDTGTCVVAWCCPCITYSNVKRRYEHLNDKGYPDPEHGGSCCNSDCMIHGCLIYCGLGWIMQASIFCLNCCLAKSERCSLSQMMNRGSIRARYNIKGSGVGDCCTSFWCTPCELTQESRELDLEEASFGGKQG